jgi:metal-dependent HD superfamily phosphatase/phosphodiesterase
MKDINATLQKSYYTALNGIVYNDAAVSVYYMTAPDDLAVDNYIIFAGVTNNDISTKGSSDTNTLMRVTIHTKSNKYNSGQAANNIAGQVLSRIYPNSQSVLTLEGAQMFSTELASDNTQDYSIKNSVSFIDRILIFRHKIYHQ